MLFSDAPPDTRTAYIVDGRPAPAWFVCDTLDAPMEVVVSRPAKDVARVTLFPKTGAAPHRGDYALGAGDPGAGNVYYPLSKNGRDAGNLHAVNPGAFDPKTPVLLPPFSSVEVEGARATCRLTPGARFIGFTSRRSVQVLLTRRGWLYQAFPLGAGDAAKSLSIGQGRASGVGNGIAYVFANKGYGYRLSTPLKGADRPATLTVTRNGRTVQSETFVAYSVTP